MYITGADSFGREKTMIPLDKKMKCVYIHNSVI